MFKTSHNSNGHSSQRKKKSRKKRQPQLNSTNTHHPTKNLFTETLLPKPHLTKPHPTKPHPKLENPFTETSPTKTKPFSSLRKPLWDWLGLIGMTSLAVASIGIYWNWKTDQAAAQRYREGLVKDYIESVKGLLLEEYHKTGTNPEIKVEEVESFVRSKTALTLKAINADVEDSKQTNVLINFLQEAGIGFVVKYDKNPETNKNQDICTEDAMNIKQHPKNIVFNYFLCSIVLTQVKLNEAELQAIILEDAYLNKAELKEAKLDNADLERANLSEANLQEASLIKANLRGALLSSANLQKADLTNANLREANFKQRQFIDPGTGKKSYFSRTNLSNAVLVGVNLIDANLQDVDLRGADLKPHRFDKIQDPQAKIIPTNLKNANLEGANLNGADLRMANLRGANLKNAIFDQGDIHLTQGDIQLTWIKFDGAIYDKDTKLPFFEKEAENHYKMRKIAPNANLLKADLRGADLRNADLRNANLTGANLRKADLRGANLENAKFDVYTHFENALYDEYTKLPFRNKIKKVKERAASIYGMLKIELKADLSSFDLSGKERDLSGQDLTGVDLSGAKLQNADLSNVELDRWTKLEGASYDLDTKLPFSKAEAKKRKMIYTPHLELRGKNKNKGEGKPVNWSGQNLEDADLEQTNLTGANLSKTNFKKANFTNSILVRANLRDADLTDANLSRADLSKANLRGAIFSSTQEDKNNIPLSSLAWTNFKGALYDDKTKLPFAEDKAKEKYGMLKIAPGADLTGADLTGADLTGADLRDLFDKNGKLVTKTNLEGINLTGANLKGAKLPKTVKLTQIKNIKLCRTIMPDGTKSNYSCQN